MQAVLYLRSSKDRSDVSIDAQRRELNELAKARGYVVVGEYADAVESGKDDDRPGFQSMLRDMRLPTRKWHFIFALDTARVARRRALAIIFEEHECKRYNIRVFYKSLPESDPITEMLLKSILQAMDEWHSLTSRVKGLAGMSENVRQGYRAGGRAPRGYKLKHIETGAIREGEPVKKSTLIFDDNAMQVRSYLQQRAKGVSRAIALQIAGMDVAVTSLLDMEHNALTYAGHTVWNRSAERNEYGYVGGKKYRDRSEWVINKNTHEALITEQEAESLLAALHAGSTTRARKTKRTYLFSGMIKNQEGKRWEGDGGYYRLEGNGCRILADSVEKPALSALMDKLQDDATVQLVLKHYKNLPNSVDENELKTLQKKMIEIDQAINKLADLIVQTTKPDALLRKIEQLEQDREALKIKVDGLSSDVAMYKSLKSIKESDIKRVIKTIVNELHDAEPEQLKEAIKQMISAVVLDSTTFNASFTWNLPAVSGVKLASPRLTELNSAYASVFYLQVAHRKRRA